MTHVTQMTQKSPPFLAMCCSTMRRADKPELLALPRFQSIMAHHTTPREAGMVFERARPKLAAYTHIARLTNDTIAAPTIAVWSGERRGRARLLATYCGWRSPGPSQ